MGLRFGKSLWFMRQPPQNWGLKLETTFWKRMAFVVIHTIFMQLLPFPTFFEDHQVRIHQGPTSKRPPCDKKLCRRMLSKASSKKASALYTGKMMDTSGVAMGEPWLGVDVGTWENRSSLGHVRKNYCIDHASICFNGVQVHGLLWRKKRQIHHWIVSYGVSPGFLSLAWKNGLRRPQAEGQVIHRGSKHIFAKGTLLTKAKINKNKNKGHFQEIPA